jgi:hypothetical protein
MQPEGTLVVIVAMRDGVVAASDTRQTIDNAIYCDGANKFLEPSRPERFIIAITGRRGFYPLNMMTAPNVCEYVRRTRREFDLGEIVKEHVERQSEANLSELDMTALAQRCNDALIQYLTANPHRLPAVSGDYFSSSVVLAAYDRAAALAVVRSFEISVDARSNKLVANGGLNERFSLDDVAEPIIAGERDYLLQHVMPGIRDEPITESTRRLVGPFPRFNFKLVKDTSLQEAADLATDLIESASRMTAKTPAKSGIGGPVDVRILGEEPRAVRWQRK